MRISVDFVNMPVLFLIVSLVISSIIINDALLFTLDSPVTSTHLRTMICYLHVYTCDMWHPLSNPNIGVCISIYSCVHCKNMHIGQAAVAKYMTSWSPVLCNCKVHHPHSPIKMQSGNKIDIFTQQHLLQFIIWFQLNCKPLPNWSVKLTTQPYNYFYFLTK